jgi:hybrid cluster-associated redox disulfide protein
MFYECNDDQSVRRYFTFIPSTRELDKVAKPYIKKLQRPDILTPASQEEFFQYWPPDGTEPQPTAQEVVSEELKSQGIRARKYFDPDMTIGEAMAVHPKVAEVFAAFHLGGCSNCGISEIETVGQVCMGYGVDIDMMLDVLESLMEDEPDEDLDDAEEASATASNEDSGTIEEKE